MSKEIIDNSVQFTYSSKDKLVTPINPQSLIFAATHGMNLMDGQPLPLTRAQRVALIRTARLNKSGKNPGISHTVSLDGIPINGLQSPRVHITPRFTFDNTGKRTGMTVSVWEQPPARDIQSKIQERESFFALFPALIASAERNTMPMGLLILSYSRHNTGRLELPDKNHANRQEKMTACIEETLRTSDIAVRLGEGEFGILLTNVVGAKEKDGLIAAARRFAEKLQTCFADTPICMGVARFDVSPSDNRSADGSPIKTFDSAQEAANFFNFADYAWAHAVHTAQINPAGGSRIFLYDPTATDSILDLSPAIPASQGEALQG